MLLSAHSGVILGDGPNRAKWPGEAAKGDEIAARFLAAAGPEFGRLLPPVDNSPLPGTKPLRLTGDISRKLVSGVDRFLLRETERSLAERSGRWKRDLGSPEGYESSIASKRDRLARIIGVRDPRTPFDGFETITTTTRPSLVARGAGFEAYAVRWPALGGIHGEGLLLVPTAEKGAAVCDVVAVPDADQTPEMLAGLVPGVPEASQFARRLAESGCRVLVPALIDRGKEFATTMNAQRRTNLTHREILYRPAFELGRHIIGYEVQKILAAVDQFERDNKGERPVGVFGYGEGGLLALHSSAIDTRIDVTGISGYFDSRQEVWKEPIYRNVFGLLHEFGDAEIASMIAPRSLVVEACEAPKVVVPPGTRGGPGRLRTPKLETVKAELARAKKLIEGLKPVPRFELAVSGDGKGPFGSEAALSAFLDCVRQGSKLAASGKAPEVFRGDFQAKTRLGRLCHEIDTFTQALLLESSYTRRAFWKKADRGSRDAKRWSDSAEFYRKYFYDEVIGRFDHELLPPNVRSRKVYDRAEYRGYEVVLDVFKDVIAYGILLVPQGIKPGGKRPVVVCQHGLEGRPRDVADPDHYVGAYNQYAIRLAERGFITFSPQNLYIFQDRFRTLQRKGNPIKKTLFSVMVPQHQQIVDWLETLSFVDPKRIAFYGLSYGGKSAMRIPPLVREYCLSICSADFNEWIWKNASTRSAYSYVSTGEYEIFEFDLGMTFNYADMAGLIAPRPFMVERGHRDGVAPDFAVAYEFAKVRRLYADLRIADRAEIEFFDGPHTIHGVGTFDFLHKHLNWPVQLNR